MTSYSTYFQCFFMVFLCISSILVKLSNIWVPFSSNCTDFCSYTFKQLLKKNVTISSRGGGGNFFVFCPNFLCLNYPRGGGVSPNLTNVSNSGVFFLHPSLIKLYFVLKIKTPISLMKPGPDLLFLA